VEFNRSLVLIAGCSQPMCAPASRIVPVCSRWVLSRDEATAITSALQTILERGRADAKYFAEPAEDVHSFVEARLVELTGDTGRKLHTAAAATIKSPRISDSGYVMKWMRWS